LKRWCASSIPPFVTDLALRARRHNGKTFDER
jgi:hypothetical protein